MISTNTSAPGPRPYVDTQSVLNVVYSIFIANSVHHNVTPMPDACVLSHLSVASVFILPNIAPLAWYVLISGMPLVPCKLCIDCNPLIFKRRVPNLCIKHAFQKHDVKKVCE